MKDIFASHSCAHLATVLCFGRCKKQPKTRSVSGAKSSVIAELLTHSLSCELGRIFLRVFLLVFRLHIFWNSDAEPTNSQVFGHDLNISQWEKGQDAPRKVDVALAAGR